MSYDINSPRLDAVGAVLPLPAFKVFVREANLAQEIGEDHNECIKAGWAAVKENWQRPKVGKKWVAKEAPAQEDKAFASVCKVDDGLGLVFGWAIVCGENGEDYYDTQGDHIPEQSMLEAAADFMENSRVAKDMHDGEAVGSVVFAFPMTTEIAKSLGIDTAKTGLLIAMKPSPDILAKFKSGEYSGFSIGGSRIEDEDVA